MTRLPLGEVYRGTSKNFCAFLEVHFCLVLLCFVGSRTSKKFLPNLSLAQPDHVTALNSYNFVLAAESPCERKFATKFASDCECDGLPMVHSCSYTHCQKCPQCC